MVMGGGAWTELIPSSREITLYESSTSDRSSSGIFELAALADSLVDFCVASLVGLFVDVLTDGLLRVFLDGFVDSYISVFVDRLIHFLFCDLFIAFFIQLYSAVYLFQLGQSTVTILSSMPIEMIFFKSVGIGL